jgi:hypothetical protein
VVRHERRRHEALDEYVSRLNDPKIRQLRRWGNCHSWCAVRSDTFDSSGVTGTVTLRSKDADEVPRLADSSRSNRDHRSREDNLFLRIKDAQGLDQRRHADLWPEYDLVDYADL